MLNGIVTDFQISIFANTGSGPESPGLSFKWSLHLQGQANTSRTMEVLQAATILVPTVSKKYIWLIKFQKKLPAEAEGNKWNDQSQTVRLP